MAAIANPPDFTGNQEKRDVTWTQRLSWVVKMVIWLHEIHKLRSQNPSPENEFSLKLKILCNENLVWGQLLLILRETILAWAMICTRAISSNVWRSANWAGDSGSNYGPGENFSLKISKNILHSSRTIKHSAPLITPLFLIQAPDLAPQKNWS